MEDFDGVFFDGFGFWKALIVVEVNKICGPVILASLSAFRAVSGEVSYFPTLEACIRCISCGGHVALEVILGAISLIPVRVLSSSEVIPSVIPLVVSSGWGPVPVYIHGNWGVVHPSGSIGRIILRGTLSLGTRVIPLGAQLLRGEASEVSISSEYVSK